MKWTIASIAAFIVLNAAGSSHAGFGPYGGIYDGSGNNGCCGSNCSYGYSLWEGFCNGGDCAVGGCAGGGCGLGGGCGGWWYGGGPGCGRAGGGCAGGGCAGGGCGLGDGCGLGGGCGGWWYGGGPGCGLAKLRGHSCGTGNAYGCGSYGGWDAGCCDGGCAGAFDNTCGCSYRGCCGGGFGGQLRGMAENFRNKMACRSWIGGGVLDSYGLTEGFCNSGFNYNYINQWNAQPQPAPVMEAPVNTHGAPAVINSGGNNGANGSMETAPQTPPAGMGETMYESSQLGDEVPQSPDFSN